MLANINELGTGDIRRRRLLFTPRALSPGPISFEVAVTDSGFPPLTTTAKLDLEVVGDAPADAPPPADAGSETSEAVGDANPGNDDNVDGDEVANDTTADDDSSQDPVVISPTPSNTSSGANLGWITMILLPFFMCCRGLLRRHRRD